MKKAIQLLIVLLLMLSFRGLIFRTLISYNDIGSRPHIELTDKNLINEIELLVATERLRTPDIIKITNRLTTSTLSFTTSKAFEIPTN